MPTIYKFSLPGAITSPSKYSAQSSMNIPGVNIQTYEMSSLRSGTINELFEAAADDVFEVVTVDDVVIYQSVDQYISKARRASRNRSQPFDETAVIEIPFEIESHDRSRKKYFSSMVQLQAQKDLFVVSWITMHRHGLD
ncbi:MAG: hypothetical protein IPL98_08680 [Saprospiraceae bacterium]|nr:hypothetical protein [Saprospiraceae bacterium]